jgi:hypothetical protein
MSDSHAARSPHDGIVAPDGADDHGTDGEHDDHAHEAAALGPIDVAAWTFGLVGVVLGLVVAAGFAIATGWIPVG